MVSFNIQRGFVQTTCGVMRLLFGFSGEHRKNFAPMPRKYFKQRTAYKLLRVRADGTLGPLFIGRHQIIPVGTWLSARPRRTAGFAFRPFWHTAPQPFAPHLSTKNRVWCRVAIRQYWRFRRPHIQGGAWLLAKRMKVLEVLHKSQHNIKGVA